MDNYELQKTKLGYWEIVNKPSIESLKTYYSQKYFQKNTSSSYQKKYSENEVKYIHEKLKQKWHLVEKTLHKDANKINVLDIGCGEGFLMAFTSLLGCKVTGLDYSSAGILNQNPDVLKFLKTGDLFELLNQECSNSKKYDVLWLQNVLEHVIDPLALMTLLRSIIKPDGIAVITVPNDFTELQALALESEHINTKYWIAPPDHLNYFNAASLENLAKATNWHCLDFLGDFPIEWFLFHPGSNYSKIKSSGIYAHAARVEIENLISNQSLDSINNFYSAAARIGIGRDLTVFLTPS